MTRYLTSISAGTDSEDNGMIADARLDMRLARRFADQPSAAQRRTFLPLIAR